MDTFKLYTIARHRMLTDGKGVTTLVALSGCPLNCRYCINMDLFAGSRVKELTPEALLENVMIDFCYFVATGGGITFGGGEPLLQTNVILDFINLLPEQISVNIETSLNAPVDKDMLSTLFLKADSFIIDIKTLDASLYESYTSISNNYFTENLDIICRLKLQDKCRLRVPVIPGYKSREAAEKEAELLRNKGFFNVEIFNYIIRDYMSQ